VNHLCKIAAAAVAASLVSPAARALTGPFSPRDFATTVLTFDATNGAAGYDDPARALGPPSADALPGVPDNSAVVSFGWGGVLTLGFDRPIADDARHPGGFDFIVFGNAFYIGDDASSTWHVPGYVEVGVDTTGKHDYGDGSAVIWYWLRGNPAPSSLSGYPFATVDFTTNYAGYANTTPTDGAGDPLAPDDPAAPDISAGTAGGDAFDLEWAVDETTGEPAALAYADFVRIHCAVDGTHPVVGRYHTQIDAVSLVRPRIAGDVDMDGAVTLSDAVLVSRAVNGLDTLSDEQRRRASLTGDGGDPTAADVSGILRIAAGVEAPPQANRTAASSL
jgi:hypothetical protein